VVGASRFFTTEDNAFDQEWSCNNLFMHPPPSSPFFTLGAVNRLLHQRRFHKFEAVVLVDALTFEWFFSLLCEEADAICSLRQRVRFIDQQGDPLPSSGVGQVLFYFGSYSSDFLGVFHSISVLSMDGLGGRAAAAEGEPWEDPAQPLAPQLRPQPQPHPQPQPQPQPKPQPQPHPQPHPQLPEMEAVEEETWVEEDSEGDAVAAGDCIPKEEQTQPLRHIEPQQLTAVTKERPASGLAASAPPPQEPLLGASHRSVPPPPQIPGISKYD